MSGTTAWVQESSMARRGGLQLADGGQLGADPRLGAGGLHAYIYKWEYARIASLEWNEQFPYPEIGDWKPVSTNVNMQLHNTQRWDIHYPFFTIEARRYAPAFSLQIEEALRIILEPLTVGNPIMVLRKVRADVALDITSIWNDEGDTVCLEVLEAETKEMLYRSFHHGHERCYWGPYKDRVPWEDN